MLDKRSRRSFFKVIGALTAATAVGNLAAENRASGGKRSQVAVPARKRGTTPAGVWETYPYRSIVIRYADRTPVAQFQGSIASRAPYGSKHTRGAYRPSTGRLYYGMGDHQSGGTGLPQDAGDTNANSALYSMDPNDPATITVENHRYVVALTGADALQPAGADEGALAWDETSDRLICSPVNSFQPFAYVAQGGFPVAGALPTDWTRIPKFVSATQFSLDNGTAGMYVGQRIRIHLNHPDFPGYTPDRWNYVPSWMDVRISAISGNVVTFVPRPGTRIHFDRDAIGFGPGFPQGDIRGTMWRDFGEVFWDDVAKVAYAGLLFMNPATRTWTREDFQLGHRRRSLSNFDYGVLPTLGSMTANNGLFVPASITGTHDAFVFMDNSGPDFGWMGYYEYDLVDHVVRMWITEQVNDPPQQIHYQLDQPCFDRTGKAAYIYCAGEAWLYKLDFTTKQTMREVFLPAPGAPGGCGHCVWLDNIRSVFIAADGPQAGTGLPTCYLYAPDSKTLTSLGNTLPDGSAIRGDEVYQAPNTAIFDGGGVDGTLPTHRHVYRAGGPVVTAAQTTLSFEKLAVAPYLAVTPVLYDKNATDTALAQRTTDIPWRVFSSWTVGRDGMAYYRGGSHNGYPGSDTHNARLSADVTQIAWRQNIGPPFDDANQTFRRPHVAGRDDLGTLGGIQGAYMYYRNDAVEQYWHMGTQHVYTRNVAYPDGMLDLQKVPTDLLMPKTMESDGNGNFDAVDGLATWSPITGKWTALGQTSSAAGAFPSTWDYAHNQLVLFNSDGVITDVSQWTRGTSGNASIVHLATLNIGLIGSVGYTAWAEWLEGYRHILYADGQINNPDGGTNWKARRLYIVDATPGALTFSEVTTPAYQALYDFNAEDVITACDYEHRHIYFLKAKGHAAGAELYRSTYDDPGGVTLVGTTNLLIDSVAGDVSAKTVTGHRALQYFAGQLYCMLRSPSGGSVDIWRKAV